jgi:protein-L-isoaspartate O-methyltransferase
MYSGIPIGNRPPDHHIIMGNIEQPWMVTEAIEFLFNRIDKSSIGFEFGSGSSTFWFSKFSKEIYSVESDRKWYYEVNSLVETLKIPNIHYSLVECEMQHLTDVDSEVGIEYSEYSNKILEYDFDFDYILIDGVARSLCIENSIRKLKNGGILIIDNAERAAYQKSMMMMIPNNWNFYKFVCPVDTTIIYEKNIF